MLDLVLGQSGGGRGLAGPLRLSLCRLLLLQLLQQEHRPIRQAQGAWVAAVEALKRAGVDALDVRDASDRLGDLLHLEQYDLVADVGALVRGPPLEKNLGLWSLKLVDFLQEVAQARAELAGSLRKQCLQVLNLGVDAHEARVLGRELFDEAQADAVFWRWLDIGLRPQVCFINERVRYEELILVRILPGGRLPLAVELSRRRTAGKHTPRRRRRHGVALQQ